MVFSCTVYPINSTPEDLGGIRESMPTNFLAQPTRGIQSWGLVYVCEMPGLDMAGRVGRQCEQELLEHLCLRAGWGWFQGAFTHPSKCTSYFQATQSVRRPWLL